jgi:hypothetical protein
MSKKKLTIKELINSAKKFCQQETKYENQELFGVTDGKAVGTYIEHKFKDFLNEYYSGKKVY